MCVSFVDRPSDEDKLCNTCYHYKACTELLKSCKITMDVQRGRHCLAYQDKALVLSLPCEVGTAINTLFSQNEIIALWCVNPVNKKQSYLLWHGIAGAIPEKYMKYQLIFFKGILPESRLDAVTLNLQVSAELNSEYSLDIFDNGLVC